MLRRLAPFLIVFAVSRVALAHQSSVTYSKVAIGDDSGTIDYTLLINSRDLYEALGIDRDRDATDEEIVAGEAKIFDYVLARLHAGGGDGVTCTTERRGLEMQNQSDRFAELRWVVKCPPPLLEIAISYDLFFDLDRGHVGMVQVTYHGRTVSRELKKGVSTFEWQLKNADPIEYRVQLDPKAAAAILGGAGGGELGDDALQAAESKLVDYVLPRVKVTGDGDADCASEFEKSQVVSSPRRLVELEFIARCTKAWSTLGFSIDLLGDQPDAGAKLGRLVVGHGAKQKVIDLARGHTELMWGAGGGAPSSMSLPAFIVKGIHHIYSGYDHICFVIGLLLIAVIRRRDGQWVAADPRAGASYVLKTVTAFTLAHSLTLIAAALGWITLPSRFVESAIAASIVYVAAENLWVQDVRNRWLLAFSFGLVHGMGFASTLKPMLPPQGLVLPLVMFNVGVELGQMSIVAVLFPILAVLAAKSAVSYRRIVVIGGSGLVGAFGTLWLLERVFRIMTISRFLGT